ncbi:hypothetical protein SS1G_04258 [Sclerotinia sclerotiorum 1980 UF-70]|uniref:CCHC-type domain-containing protein n=1 Tax=Sclerotinia sclerotiorum (strain ATCC 18683 / 1980 / Ss-1) TaxID=665079 RepID=A7EG17_SCLS1|nr:hypothetical protein SS1G_04258 [Sclerotinia sclerotiorum 1980 UF-70]EDO01783.1 hypothetical protein SS1G_04258 [Sclerotinia sclerotiorum 1980 UF-70]
MQLDATFKNKLFKEEVERRCKDKLCFECGKPGHRARDCRSKRSSGGGYHKKFGKGQLNATFVPQLYASYPIEDDSYERKERQKEIDAILQDQEGLMLPKSDATLEEWLIGLWGMYARVGF